METISVKPTSAGYTALATGDRKATNPNGPSSVISSGLVNTPREISLNWLVGFDDFETLRAMFRRNYALGNPPWQLEIILDAYAPALYTIKFIEGTIQFQGRQGLAYSIVAKAVAMPNDRALIVEYPIFATGESPARAIPLTIPTLPRHFTMFEGKPTWFKVVTTQTRTITVSTVGVLWDSELGAYSAFGKFIATDDDSGGDVPDHSGGSSILVLTAAVAGTYYFVVGAWDTIFGTDDFRVTSDNYTHADLVLAIS